jgi:hypothetical protein
VLVLPDADGFRVDLHQFGQGILQAPRDGDGTSYRHVEIRQLLAGEGGGGIDGGACLRDHDLGELEIRVLRNQFARELVGLA